MYLLISFSPGGHAGWERGSPDLLRMKVRAKSPIDPHMLGVRAISTLFQRSHTAWPRRLNELSRTRAIENEVRPRFRLPFSPGGHAGWERGSPDLLRMKLRAKSPNDPHLLAFAPSLRFPSVPTPRGRGG